MTTQYGFRKYGFSISTGAKPEHGITITVSKRNHRSKRRRSTHNKNSLQKKIISFLAKLAFDALQIKAIVEGGTDKGNTLAKEITSTQNVNHLTEKCLIHLRQKNIQNECINLFTRWLQWYIFQISSMTMSTQEKKSYKKKFNFLNLGRDLKSAALSAALKEDSDFAKHARIVYNSVMQKSPTFITDLTVHNIMIAFLFRYFVYQNTDSHTHTLDTE